MKTSFKGIERIVFLTRSHLGDLLLMTPAIHAVRERFPQARIFILVEEGCREVFTQNPDVDEILTFDVHALRRSKGIKKLGEELKIIRLLRRQEFDLAICFYPEDRTTVWAFMSGARYRVGPSHQPFRSLLNVKVSTSETAAGVREYFLDTVRAIGAVPSTLQMRFTVSADAEAWAESILRSHFLAEKKVLIGIHPGASGEYKIWPPENFASVLEGLRRDESVEVILFQGPGDDEIVHQISGRMNPPPLIVDTSMSLERLAALMKRCHLCIVADAGPRHVAASVGTQTLALFRRTHAAAWRIYSEEEGNFILESSKSCPHCPAEKCRDKTPAGEIFGAYCLREISVEDVLLRVQEILKKVR